MEKLVIDRYVEQKRRIMAAEATVKRLKEEMKPMEKEMLQRFEHEGLQSVKNDHGQTIFLRSQLWAGKDPEVSDEAFIRSLQENDMGDLVQSRVNMSSLSSAIREKAGNYLNLSEIDIPYGVRVTEKTEVRVNGIKLENDNGE